MPDMDTAGEELVPKLAAMARIDVPPEKAEALGRDFAAIVAYIDQLQQLALGPAAEPVVPPLHNVFRDDVNPTAPGSWTQIVADAFPKRSGDALVVKKIISHD